MRTVYHYDKKLKKVVEGSPPERVPDHPFYIMPLFKEYQAVGVDNRIVKTRTEHKNMLKDHGFEEVGNEVHPLVKHKRGEQQERGER